MRACRNTSRARSPSRFRSQARQPRSWQPFISLFAIVFRLWPLPPDLRRHEKYDPTASGYSGRIGGALGSGHSARTSFPLGLPHRSSRRARDEIPCPDHRNVRLSKQSRMNKPIHLSLSASSYSSRSLQKRPLRIPEDGPFPVVSLVVTVIILIFGVSLICWEWRTAHENAAPQSNIIQTTTEPQSNPPP